MSTLDEYASFDGLGLAKLVQSGEAKPAELVDAAIARIERHNPALNAVVQFQYEQAREQASRPEQLPDGPFRGVPFLVKALYHAEAGVAMTNASRYFEHVVPDEDCELVARYKQAGLINCGRTNTPENGLNATTEPVLYGPTRNPWNTDTTPGGSSGGAAAAVSSGMVPVANASDGGGSIRIPASCCGLYGLKPTRMRTPAGPVAGDPWNGLACMHVVSRTVRDSAAMLDVTAGPSAGDPYAAPHQATPFLDEAGRDPGHLKVAVCRTPLLDHPVHGDCLTALDEAARLIADLGHDVDEAEPAYDRNALAQAWWDIVVANEARDLVEGPMLVGRPPTDDDLEPWTRATMDRGATLSGADVIGAIRVLHWESRQIGWFMQDWDLVLSPTLGKPPVPLGELATDESDFDTFAAKLGAFIPFTPLANCTGQPSATLPLCWNADDLPIGVMLTGRFGDEATLLRLSAQLEAARSWNERHPPIWD